LEITEDQPKPEEGSPDKELDSCSASRPRVPRIQLSIDSQLMEHINTIQNILEPYEFCSLKERAILLARSVVWTGFCRYMLQLDRGASSMCKAWMHHGRNGGNKKT